MKSSHSKTVGIVVASLGIGLLVAGVCMSLLTIVRTFRQSGAPLPTEFQFVLPWEWAAVGVVGALLCTWSYLLVRARKGNGDDRVDL